MNEEAPKPVKTTSLSTEPYKGVRDFYPDDMDLHNYIIGIWRKVAESYGYREYNASVLEPAELYKAKSGDEIVNEQTYTFTDRGEREVTLRPEMTPTVARMVAARRKELVFPARWYSMPNLFRYEKPQRGRLREFWQLNVDIFGVTSIKADVELISMAHDIMLAFGIKETDFEIRINNRKVINYILNELYNLTPEAANSVCKLLDRKAKIPESEFRAGLIDILGDTHHKEFEVLINSKNFDEFASHLGKTSAEHEGIAEIRQAIESLNNMGVANVVFDQSLMRGFDYYTGLVFEVFDKHPDNRRALFGGGRYDELLGLFGGEKIPASGFGMGDATIENALEVYGLLPKSQSEGGQLQNPIDIYFCVMTEAELPFAMDLAQKARENGFKATVDYSLRKIGDQIRSGDRNKARFVAVVGAEEVKTGKVKFKELATGNEKDLF